LRAISALFRDSICEEVAPPGAFGDGLPGPGPWGATTISIRPGPGLDPVAEPEPGPAELATRGLAGGDAEPAPGSKKPPLPVSGSAGDA
jgi:hypothetical protein